MVKVNIIDEMLGALARQEFSRDLEEPTRVVGIFVEDTEARNVLIEICQMLYQASLERDAVEFNPDFCLVKWDPQTGIVEIVEYLSF